jgi:hypothetical protein
VAPSRCRSVRITGSGIRGVAFWVFGFGDSFIEIFLEVWRFGDRGDN